MPFDVEDDEPCARGRFCESKLCITQQGFSYPECPCEDPESRSCELREIAEEIVEIKRVAAAEYEVAS